MRPFLRSIFQWHLPAVGEAVRGNEFGGREGVCCKHLPTSTLPFFLPPGFEKEGGQSKGGSTAVAETF